MSSNVYWHAGTLAHWHAPRQLSNKLFGTRSLQSPFPPSSPGARIGLYNKAFKRRRLALTYGSATCTGNLVCRIKKFVFELLNVELLNGYYTFLHCPVSGVQILNEIAQQALQAEIPHLPP